MQLPPYELESQTAGQVTLKLALEQSHPCFNGHFEGLPVLAGVVQVGWVLALASHYFERPFEFQAMKSTKFQQLVRPPCSLRLTLQLRGNGEQLRFRYTNTRGTCSSGHLWVKSHG